MNILVLGYTGYIGSEIYQKLIKNNFSVNGLAKKNVFKSKYHINLSFLKKKKNLIQIVKKYDVIINCFGEIKNENLMTKTHIWEHKRIVNIISLYAKKLSKEIHWIQISTLGVYGFDGFGPTNQKIYDKTSTNPLSIYEKTKLVSEKILKDCSNKYFKNTILRVGTVISNVSKKNTFDRMIQLLNKKICIFIENKETIFNIIYLEDLSNIISKCINNHKVLGKTYVVAINISIKKLISHYEKKNFFILKLNFKKELVKALITFLNFFRKKKIKLHKVNFFLYERNVFMSPILIDLNYKIKFNLKAFLKKKYQ